ncbi:hypothetical protein [Tolypothrix sp. VBCCA 56010]|uniref:hypothetical protein n=1 Tax=Tolypothrix sp. VBCCA 56010 TaxID=3137731 RepID=UPI003D7D910D
MYTIKKITPHKDGKALERYVEIEARSSVAQPISFFSKNFSLVPLEQGNCAKHNWAVGRATRSRQGGYSKLVINDLFLEIEDFYFLLQTGKFDEPLLLAAQLQNLTDTAWEQVEELYQPAIRIQG